MQDHERPRNWDAGRITQLRKECGLTKEQFAHTLGVTVGTVWHWEAGDQRPKGLSLKALDQISIKEEL